MGASASADQALIVVADNGPGTAAADLPHRFDRFYRVDRARNRKHGRHRHSGGLGLSIARKLVLMHHGALVVESQPDAGITFTIRLPLTSKAGSG